MMIAVLDNVRHALEGKTYLFGALFSSSLGLGAAELIPSGVNTIVIVALCGAAGAFFGSLPRIIAARSGADASSRNLLAKELRLLLVRIHLLDQRIVLEQAAKHIVHSEHNNLVVHVKNLEQLLRQSGGVVPDFKIKCYEEMLGPIDREVKELMLRKREEEE